MKQMVYRSKVDPWLGFVLLAAIAIPLVILPAAMTEEPPIALLALLLPLALPVWMLRSTHYTLHRERLDIRCGPFAWRVPLREIQGIEPTRSSLSGPALSLDRLRIDYGEGRSVMISPLNQEAFLDDLEQRRQALRTGVTVCGH